MEDSETKTAALEKVAELEDELGHVSNINFHFFYIKPVGKKKWAKRIIHKIQFTETTLHKKCIRTCLTIVFDTYLYYYTNIYI